jgi:hypothetical protein
VVREAPADGNLADRVVVGGLVVGVLFGIAALSVRGLNRALHVGDFDAARFPARVLAVVCVPVALFLLFYGLGQGHPGEPSMLWPFLFLALAWAPRPFTALPTARQWPAGSSPSPADRRGWVAQTACPAPGGCWRSSRPGARQCRSSVAPGGRRPSSATSRSSPDPVPAVLPG